MIWPLPLCTATCRMHCFSHFSFYRSLNLQADQALQKRPCPLPIAAVEDAGLNSSLQFTQKTFDSLESSEDISDSHTDRAGVLEDGEHTARRECRQTLSHTYVFNHPHTVLQPQMSKKRSDMPQTHTSNGSKSHDKLPVRNNLSCYQNF